MFTLYVLAVPLFGAYGALLYAEPGHNVTLPCFYVTTANNLCWYKQVAGEQPHIVSSVYKHLPASNNFHNQFKGNKRFAVHVGPDFYHLNISKVRAWDSAMYYCGSTSVAITEFDNGTFLALKESSRRSYLQQPASDSAKPGGSVTLNCTVHTGTSGAEHSVYWFKKEDSRNSHLGMMYVHRSSGQCAHSLEPPALSCVHGLAKRNVSRSDAGMYYCAVAMCGEILFGEGTRLEVRDTFPLLVQCSVAALLVSGVLNIVLVGVLCKMSRRKHLHPQVRKPPVSVPEDTSDSQNEEFGALHYVALDYKKSEGKIRRHRSPEEDTIYTGVRQSDLK
ncbi:Viral T-cell receptor beta chain-like T17T-22 [Liparis tanakae]|nr:Viral T-cell receptor beta chain-like T17T-22 [Liparis tanakae]